jgi:hypothetical protein
MASFAFLAAFEVACRSALVFAFSAACIALSLRDCSSLAAVSLLLMSVVIWFQMCLSKCNCKAASLMLSGMSSQ